MLRGLSSFPSVPGMQVGIRKGIPIHTTHTKMPLTFSAPPQTTSTGIVPSSSEVRLHTTNPLQGVRLTYLI